MTEQMPSWVPLPLVIVLAAWSFGVGIGFQRHLARLWFSPGSGGWRTAGRVLLLHAVVVSLVLAGAVAAIQLRDATTYRTWPLGALVVAVVGPLGPIIASVMPSRSGTAPDKETLTRAGASETQAAVVRWLSAPFAILEMSMLLGVGLPALAA